MVVAERKRRLKPDQRRALIVAAAAAEFGARGPRDSRMEDIARRAGVTKAVIYDHFASKEDLQAEVLLRASDDLMGVVTAAVFGQATPPAMFRAALRETFAITAARPDIRALLVGQGLVEARVHKVSVKAQRTARRAIATLFLSNPGFLEGHPDRTRRAEHVAQASMGAINALVALGIEQRLEPEYLAELAIEVLDPGMARMAGEPA
jgi:AcrR family transcriptional regulator